MKKLFTVVSFVVLALAGSGLLFAQTDAPILAGTDLPDKEAYHHFPPMLQPAAARQTNLKIVNYTGGSGAMPTYSWACSEPQP